MLLGPCDNNQHTFVWVLGAYYRGMLDLVQVLAIPTIPQEVAMDSYIFSRLSPSRAVSLCGPTTTPEVVLD